MHAPTQQTAADPVPSDSKKICAWFAEAVRHEIEELGKTGKQSQYEVHSGSFQNLASNDDTVFRFRLADGTLIPEDSSGFLHIGESRYRATVISQQENVIFIQVVGLSVPNVPHAILMIDDTALLEKLAERLEKASSTGVGP